MLQELAELALWLWGMAARAEVQAFSMHMHAAATYSTVLQGAPHCHRWQSTLLHASKGIEPIGMSLPN